PRKVRSIANLIKGLPVGEAEAQLILQRRRASLPILKLLRSAIAAAGNTKKISKEMLYIESLRVDGGPMLKRHLPRARGSASPIQKKMSHVIIVLAEKERLPKPRFSIVVQKKAKMPGGGGKKPKKKDKPATEEETKKAEKPNFFKRAFSRKAGFAK
ncbi:MAG: 50S ribosomal protein L22, partial [bacterium]|nr:50S ribosomal protein L22 [bacterium]